MLRYCLIMMEITGPTGHVWWNIHAMSDEMLLSVVLVFDKHVMRWEWGHVCACWCYLADNVSAVCGDADPHPVTTAFLPLASIIDDAIGWLQSASFASWKAVVSCQLLFAQHLAVTSILRTRGRLISDSPSLLFCNRCCIDTVHNMRYRCLWNIYKHQ